MAMNGGGGMGSFYGNLPEEVTLNGKWKSPGLSKNLKEENKEQQEKQVETLQTWHCFRRAC